MIYIFFCIFIILCLNIIFYIYRYYEKKYIKNLEELPKGLNSIIVLGAGVRKDGKPCDLLADRLFTAVQVYNKNICKKVLLTGDHKDDNYNEVAVMKTWIMEKQISEEDIILDGFGFCTFNSMYNAKKKYNIESAIIVTNRYHLPRAIYIAKRLGITAYGIASDIRCYDRMKKYKKRERLAQIKDFILVNLCRIKEVLINY